MKYIKRRGGFSLTLAFPVLLLFFLFLPFFLRLILYLFSGMAQSQGWVRRYAKAFCKGFFVAVPVAVTFLDRVACVARVEGASMQVKTDVASFFIAHSLWFLVY